MLMSPEDWSPKHFLSILLAAWPRKNNLDVRISPKNSAPRVKPKIVSSLSANAGTYIAINIGMNSPIFASDVTQDLKIYFLMFLEYHHLTSVITKTKSLNRDSWPYIFHDLCP